MGEERELSQDQMIAKIYEKTVRDEERLTNHLNNHKRFNEAVKWAVGITVSVLTLKWFNK